MHDTNEALAAVTVKAAEIMLELEEAKEVAETAARAKGELCCARRLALDDEDAHLCRQRSVLFAVLCG